MAAPSITSTSHPPPSPSRAVNAARTPEPANVEPGDAPRLDGRRAHVLDRAAEYVRLAEQGLSGAQIARRRRKSPGHVSILLRLGRALATVPQGERAALRSPRVTWRLVQRLVRADVDPASLRKQLRDAVGGFSTHNVDARQRRRRPTPGHDATLGATLGATPTRGVAWGWDATWFADDPVGYAAAHLAHLTHVHDVVAGRAVHAVRARAATGTLTGVDAGQSLRGLQRRLRQVTHGTSAGPEPTAPQQQALEAFALLGRALHAAGAAGAAIRDGTADGSNAPGAQPTRPVDVAAPTPDEIEADLDEP